jgi:large subunit ribosomal protein L15
MSLQLHNLVPNKGSHARSRRIGRGPGSGRGKTAGKGTKGQRSRSGGKGGLIMLGMKQMLLSFPKNRGFRSLTEKAATLPVSRLEVFQDGTKVDMFALRQAGIIKRIDARVKIVSGGEFTKKLVIVKLPVTPGAKEQIEKAGGSVTLPKPSKKKAKKNAKKA